MTLARMRLARTTPHLALLAVLIPLALPAQVVLVSLDGINETPVGAGYNYGEVAAGDSQDVRFHARNLGSAAVTITNLKVTNVTGRGLFHRQHIFDALHGCAR